MTKMNRPAISTCEQLSLFAGQTLMPGLTPQLEPEIVVASRPAQLTPLAVAPDEVAGPVPGATLLHEGPPIEDEALPVPMVTTPVMPVSANIAVPSTAIPTFAEAIALIDTFPKLRSKGRRDLKSALTVAAGIIGQPLANIVCDTSSLNLILYAKSPGAFGFSSAYFAQVTSRLRAVLRELGRHADPIMSEDELGEPWRTFLGCMPQTQQRSSLRAFAHWADRRGLWPVQLTNDDLMAFCRHEFSTRLFPGHRDRAYHLSRVWRVAVAVQETPSAYPHLVPPRRRDPYVPHLNTFPASFQADMATYRARLGKTNATLFSAAQEDRGPRRPLAKATIDLREFALRQAAAAIIATGIPLHELHGLRDLVCPAERPGIVLDHFFARAGERIGGQLANIAETLRQLGKHYVRLPEAECQHLRELARGAAPPSQQGMTGKVRQRLQILRQPENAAMLLALPELLIERARNEPSLSPREKARLVRTAILIEMLIFAPLRVKNLQDLRLGSSLVSMGHGKAAHFVVLFREDETKNAAAIEWPLPVETSRRIQSYIDQERAILAAPGNRFLFAGDGQNPFSLPAVKSTLQATIAREIGIHVHPHLMRHFAAWLFLDANPGCYELVRRVLGHKRVETTIRSYCGLETDAAAATFQKAVIARQNETALQAKAAFKRRGRSLSKRRKGGA